MPHKQFEIIEHTADIGIRAYGGTREKLFENCAIGMMSIILGAGYMNSLDSSDGTGSNFNLREETIGQLFRPAPYLGSGGSPDPPENGMKSILNSPSQKRSMNNIIVEVEAEDDEDILYSFLAEILYLFEGEGFVPLKFNNSVINDQIFKTSIPGVNFNPDLFEIINEVKAVTFHRMKIEKKGDIWQTDVIFDI